MTIPDDLGGIAAEAQSTLEEFRGGFAGQTSRVLKAAAEWAQAAWSGPNLGYHSTVYFSGFLPPPSGVSFSPEWGLEERWPIHEPHRGWHEMDFGSARQAILDQAGSPDLDRFSQLLRDGQAVMSRLKEASLSALLRLPRKQRDEFIKRKIQQIETLKFATPEAIEKTLISRGAGMCRDSRAYTQGLKLAPHQSVLALTLSATVIENELGSVLIMGFHW